MAIWINRFQLFARFTQATYPLKFRLYPAARSDQETVESQPIIASNITPAVGQLLKQK
jgi:hypothetical protein